MTYEDNETNRGSIETFEGKLLDVQSKLRVLQDEKSKSTGGVLGAGQSSVGQGGYTRGGGRSMRGGRGGGRSDRGGGFATNRDRGRGRFARAGNLSFDSRPKTILISNAPIDFENQAAAHFAR
jgi:hypothetical protein